MDGMGRRNDVNYRGNCGSSLNYRVERDYFGRDFGFVGCFYRFPGQNEHYLIEHHDGRVERHFWMHKRPFFRQKWGSGGAVGEF